MNSSPTHPLTQYRQKNNETLEALAQRAGTSKASLSRLENRKQNPPRRVIEKIMEATGLSAGEVLGLEDAERAA